MNVLRAILLDSIGGKRHDLCVIQCVEVAALSISLACHNNPLIGQRAKRMEIKSQLVVQYIDESACLLRYEVIRLKIGLTLINAQYETVAHINAPIWQESCFYTLLA